MKIYNNKNKQKFLAQLDEAIKQAQALHSLQLKEVDADTIKALQAIRKEVAAIEINAANASIDLEIFVTKHIHNQFLISADFYYFNFETISMLAYYEIIKKPGKFNRARIQLRDAIAQLEDGAMKSSAEDVLSHVEHAKLSDALHKDELIKALNETRKFIYPHEGETADFAERSTNFNTYIESVDTQKITANVFGALCVLAAVGCLAALVIAGALLLPCGGAGAALLLAAVFFAGSISSMFGAFSLFSKASEYGELSEVCSTLRNSKN